MPRRAKAAVTESAVPRSATPEIVDLPPVDGPTMPDLLRARRLARQTIDSALTTLHSLGVDDSRMTIESAGRGWEAGTIVEQSPAPGTPLTARTHVALRVAGASAIDALPFAMRDEHEHEFRSDRLFALFDSPLAKLAHRVRRGGDYFVASPDDMVRTRRWIEEIFQLSAESWSPARWFAIARLLPALHRIAGRELAVRVAFRLVFALPVDRIAMDSEVVALRERHATLLGARNARLGVDAIAGAGLRNEASVRVRFGPIDLATYRAHQGADARRERHSLYQLVLPMHLARTVREQWLVGDASRPPRVGLTGAEDDAAILGVTSYLGAAPQRRSA